MCVFFKPNPNQYTLHSMCCTVYTVHCTALHCSRQSTVLSGHLMPHHLTPDQRWFIVKRRTEGQTWSQIVTQWQATYPNRNCPTKRSIMKHLTCNSVFLYVQLNLSSLFYTLFLHNILSECPQGYTLTWDIL